MADNEMYYSNGAVVNSQATANGSASSSDRNMSANPGRFIPEMDPGFTYPELDPGFTYPDVNGPMGPDDGRPVDPDFSYPAPPPVSPPISNIPVTPNIPIPPFPPTCSTCPPIQPSPPSPQYYGKVRFLNASTMVSPVNISIDGNNYAINSRFGTITNYDWVSDGFHTVTVRSSNGMRNILYQQTFPFVAGEKTTMILVDVGRGLEMVKVADTGCTNVPYNTGCYRVANMSYAGSSYDVMLYGGDTVFRNVTFQNVTSYKQAVAGTYQFYVTNSGNFSVVREMPFIVVGAYPSTGMVNEPLVSIQVDIKPGTNYTTYLIGNNWSESGFRALTVTD